MGGEWPAVRVHLRNRASLPGSGWRGTGCPERLCGRAIKAGFARFHDL